MHARSWVLVMPFFNDASLRKSSSTVGPCAKLNAGYGTLLNGPDNLLAEPKYCK